VQSRKGALLFAKMCKVKENRVIEQRNLRRNVSVKGYRKVDTSISLSLSPSHITVLTTRSTYTRTTINSLNAHTAHLAVGDGLKVLLRHAEPQALEHLLIHSVPVVHLLPRVVGRAASTQQVSEIGVKLRGSNLHVCRL